ncbi:hypothetical protein AU255_00520 [Methyloprofundus sedimenti]|uniref:FecR protein domain-containing protein n=1 Tax=Methyloprofundus sedimenti TaxID=1420851 RepID=A0A1V8M4I4_9GAMM|nr:FecR family protein [Methyloprofundus sedimenti]OQK16428.1 hypothetical protein AU255_00520 [Methyloprofundus sedimenti]
MAKNTVPEITSMSDQAINWVILLHSGQSTNDDSINALQWRSRSPAHERAYVEALVLWQEMGYVMMPQPEQTHESLDFKEQKSPSQSKIKYGYLASFAAAAMLLILILPISRYADQWQSDYYTQVGTQQSITLADGSIIQLNTDSALSIQYEKNRRVIQLHRGQALFTVAADPQRPFEVITEDIVIRALGTIFEVWNNQDETRVTVLEHAVQLSSLGKNTHTQIARIESGYQTQYNNTTGVMHTEAIDIIKNGAWQRGKLIFKNQPLADVIVELERYLPGRIMITDEKLRKLQVSGVFPVQQPDQILAMIKQTLAIKVTHLSPYLTLLHK